MAHNGGRSQANFGFLQIGGAYPLLNHLKTAQHWVLVDNTNIPEPSTLNGNGYPTTITNGGVYTVFFIPSQVNRPGNWIIKWIGGGTVRTNFTLAIVSGSLSGTDGRCVITPTGSVHANGSLRIDLGISAITTGITNLAFIHEDDEAAFGTLNADGSNTGDTFGVKFKERLVEGNFGVLRFLNWFPTNITNATIWNTRKPIGYVFYEGFEFRSSLYGGATTNIGDNYSLAFSGFVLADKAMALLKFNASASGDSATLNINSTGAIPIMNESGDATSAGGNDRPLIDKFACVVYDADLNCYIKFGGKLAGTGHNLLNNGVPPELMVQLCNEVGAHPWLPIPYLALDPKTDYATSLATYCRDNLASGLIPLYEPVNEIWNFASGFYGTRYAWNKADHHWVGDFNHHNWYGKVLSTMGQDISAVYSDDRARYQVICGVQTATTPSNSNDRLNSSDYVNIDAGSAAKNWVTHLAVTNYWNTTYSAGQKTQAATDYAAAGTDAARLVIATAYIDANDLATLNTKYSDWKAWGVGLGINGLNAYEGGWSPDYVTGETDLNTLKEATKAVQGLNGYTTTNYENFEDAGGTFPSCFQLASDNNAWSVFDPDIYAIPSPQWDAIVAFNAVEEAVPTIGAISGNRLRQLLRM